MDVLWFRAGKTRRNRERFARIDAGKMMVTLDRGDYWQCAYVIPKGEYEAVKARGLDCVPRRRRRAGADPRTGASPTSKAGTTSSCSPSPSTG